jgi:rubrerythrin
MANNQSISDIITTALERERKGRDFYRKAAAETESEKAKHMFEWLVTVEESHILKLSTQKESLGGSGRFEPMPLAPVQRVSRSDLPHAPEAKGHVSVDTSELDALAMAIKAEKEAAAFYAQAAASSTDPEANALLNHLASDEQEHLAILDEEYNWLNKSGEYFTIHRFRIP